MPWKRRSPLWPLVGALMVLLALAVDAPRNWQRPALVGSSLPAPELTDETLWTSVVLLSDLESVEPLESVASPVVAPTLPPIEADSYSLEDFDFSQVQVPEKLPSREPLDLDVLIRIHDNLMTLVGQLPALSESVVPQQEVAAIRSVQVSGPNDRLAMRTEPDRSPVEQPTEPVAVVEEETAPVKPLLRYHPTSLVARLEAVGHDSPASPWAKQTLALIRQLAEETTIDLADAPDVVAGLQSLAKTANAEALQLADHAVKHEWLRSLQAVEQRAVIWKAYFDRKSLTVVSPANEPVVAQKDVMPVVGEVAAQLSGTDNGEAWREYLLLDRIAGAASEGAGIDVKGRRTLAQEVLSRMIDARLTDAQRQFVQTETLANLREAIRPWAMGPVDLETLAALVELYEAKPSLRYATALAQLQQRLQWSPDAQYQQLAEHLNQHYRGTNMRVALTEDLMNRMMPKPSSTMSSVNEQIAGAKVKGRARTVTQVQVRLLPNDQSWQMALEARGAVYSNTRSQTWPARVHNSAKMFYQAHKMILIDGQGMRVSKAKSTARGRNDLVGVDSEFDPVPIVGSLLRGGARGRHP
jgi:hypothetical protein